MEHTQEKQILEMEVLSSAQNDGTWKTVDKAF